MGFSLLDPFGNDAKKTGVNSANSAIQQAADEFDLRTAGIDYNVGSDMVNKYMSPDVAFRQNTATNQLAQLYGNSGALNSSAARAGIMNANAGIAAQAWNDAFGRANDITKSNNQLAYSRAANMQDAKQGQAANNVALAMGQNGWLTNTANAVGGIGQGVGAIMKAGG